MSHDLNLTKSLMLNAAL
uniref:Uncharacterized protein n=1 Tax=Arundo donax TaxID=35708 RepID=A0A0A9BP77_ARUDO